MPYYNRRSLRVEAWHVDANDWDGCQHIATWCGGILLPHEDYLTFNDRIVLLLHDEYVLHDEWVVRDQRGHHHVLTDTAFHDLFEETP